MPPKVILIVPTFNGERWIDQTLACINNFTYPNLHILISDDCSTDNTRNRIKSFLESVEKKEIKSQHKWTFIQNSQNLGPWENFNTCVRKVLKEMYPDQDILIACQDQDDTSSPDRIDLCVNVLLQNTNVGVVSCSLALTGLIEMKEPARAYAPPIPSIIAWSWVYKNEKVGVRPNQNEGDLLWCKLVHRAEIPWAALDEVLYTHLIHEDQHSFYLYKDKIQKIHSSVPVIALSIAVNVSIDPIAYYSHLKLYESMILDSRFATTIIVVADEEPVDRARNKSIETMIEAEADYWMAIDADMIVQSDACSKLYTTLITREAQVVSGHCRRRGWPYTSIWLADGEKEDGSELGDMTIKPIPASGLACTLIDLNWLRKHLSPPFCSLAQDQHGSTRSEDAWLFGDIVRRGGKMYGDPSVRALHGGRREIITDENVELLRKASEVSEDQIHKFITTGVW